MRRRRASDHPLFEFAAAVATALLLTFVAFGPGLRAAFVSDDINAIVQNEWVAAGDVNATGIATHLSWWGQGRSDSPGYRPAATLSFALNRATGGPDPYGFRIVNFAMNALCAALLFALLRALAVGREASAAAAALFAVLPIHSEAVIWIVGRAELGAAAGFLLAALLCLLYRSGGAAWQPVAAAAVVVAGMAFKENTVTALAVPAIWYATGERTPRAARRDLVAFGAMATGVLLYLLLRWTADGLSIAGKADLLDNQLALLPAGTRLLGALAVFGRYVALTFWPASLSVDYSYDALAIGRGFLGNADSVVAIAFLALGAGVALRGPGRRDVVLAGLLLAAAAFTIVSNTVFVLGTILGERLFYLPTAGLCVAAAALVEPLFSTREPRRRLAAAAACAGLVLAAVAVDRARAREWLTPVSLFESAAREQPRSARAHMELGSAYGNSGRIDDAMKHFQASLQIWPEYAAAAYNQGNALARAQRLEEAAAAYRRCLGLEPALTRAWHNLALTERLLGRKEQWLAAMRGAVSSGASPALVGELGEALIANGRHDEAVSVYDGLIASGGAGAASHFNRGVAHHHLGGCAVAVDDYRRATTAQRPPPEAFVAAAGCLRELGRDAEAAAVEQASKVANRDTRR